MIETLAELHICMDAAAARADYEEAARLHDRISLMR
jgi:excinuclease UvrABC nuclease subunit